MCGVTCMRPPVQDGVAGARREIWAICYTMWHGFGTELVPRKHALLDLTQCVVTEAGDGRAAIEQIRLDAPDLILLDILMPVMDGYEVLEQLKSDEALRNIPVIVISAVDQLESAIRCIELGAEDYLTKPFNTVM